MHWLIDRYLKEFRNCRTAAMSPADSDLVGGLRNGLFSERELLLWSLQTDPASPRDRESLLKLEDFLLERGQEVVAEDATTLIRSLKADWRRRALGDAIVGGVNEILARAAQVRPSLRDAAADLRDYLQGVADDPETERVRLAVDRWLARFPEPTARARHLEKVPLWPFDGWAEAALAEITRLTDDEIAAWTPFLAHANSVSAARPSKRWQKTAARLAAALPVDWTTRIVGWLANFDTPSTAPDQAGNPWALHPWNVETLRGLVWTLAQTQDDEVARALGRLASSSFRKRPQFGMRSVKLGNACVWALGEIGSRAALAQLAYLKVRLRFAAAQKEVDKALNGVAERLGVPREDIEELAVPGFGMTEVGRLIEPLGDFTAELTVAPPGRADIVWRTPAGKVQKSVPAAVRTGHADELKELKATARDIARMLPAQRDRIDSLFLERRSWTFADWRERHLDHPLLGILARRIIWTFETPAGIRSGIWRADRMVDVDDEPLDGLDGPDVVVRLWHPIGLPLDDVLAWRGWLERHEVRQPFKQAHREVYVLTDAERRTATYSNRFASHILRQHQFHALCGVRGWRDQLRLSVDAASPPPTKRLPAWGLRAEFWVHAGDDEISEVGTFLRLATDQVRFYRIEADARYAHMWGGQYVTDGVVRPENEPVPLEQIPPLVLSEIFRDVDLFVGVASVGNDPTWADGGPGGQHRDYWTSYSFGDLTAAAQTRRDVLQRLIPRLKIADRCSFNDRYLVVRGDLRTYRIHLGSGNILMQPNDQYLCIVQDAGNWKEHTGSPFLPFEGDRTLSIILSKALLLAADTKIQDPTIVRQIRMD
ncbi:MAG: DUF4132 domain-containing protein [Planctomyces sp.]|nr:DUF4132 domain-containing protein [Planctomyces sp.]